MEDGDGDILFRARADGRFGFGPSGVSSMGAGTFVVGIDGGHTADIAISKRLQHLGDSNTYMDFTAADQIEFVAGGVDMIHITEDDSQDKIVFNEGGADVDFRVETNNKPHGVFIDAGNDAILIGSDTLPGADVFAFISGSTGDAGQGSAVRGTALVGGDLFVSGTVLGKQYHCMRGTYQRGNSDAIMLGLYNNNEATSFIDDTTMVAPFSGRPVRIILRSDSGSGLGLTAVGFHTIGDGTEFPSSTPIESINNFGAAANTPVHFDFTTTGSQIPATAFSAGNSLGFSVNPTNTHGEVNFCIILEYIVKNIVSGTTLS